MYQPDSFSGLCAELAQLYQELGTAIAPDVTVKADRSTVSAIVAPSLTATAPRWSQVRRVLGPRSPADDNLISLKMEISGEVLGLARYAREALGHVGARDSGVVVTLGILANLLTALGAGHSLSRRAYAVLGKLWHRSRITLDIDRRPVVLAPCPVSREPYPKSWIPAQVDGEWVWVVSEEWSDGVCRQYDWRESRPDDDPPVDVWQRSRLRCRDPSAAMGSEDRAIRCPGCRSVWRTDEELRRLGRMLADDGTPDPAASVRALLYARIAFDLRWAMGAGRLGGHVG